MSANAFSKGFGLKTAWLFVVAIFAVFVGVNFVVFGISVFRGRAGGFALLGKELGWASGLDTTAAMRNPLEDAYIETQQLVAAGYTCAILSLGFLPPLLGLAGVIIGIVTLKAGHTNTGIVQILLSFICALIGMLFSFAVNSQ